MVAYTGTVTQLIIPQEKIIELDIKWNETLENWTIKAGALYIEINKVQMSMTGAIQAQVLSFS